MKKVLVIGCSSMVGSRFEELNTMVEIVCADKLAHTGHAHSFHIDITDQASVVEAVKQSHADVVLQFSAFTDVSLAEKERNQKGGMVWQVNVDGTKHVAHACKQFDKKLVYISTDFVFSGTAGSYHEQDTTISSPDEGTWYGWTKLQGERVIAQTLGDNAIIARIAYPYRASFDKKLDFVRKMLKGMREDTLHPLFADQYISPVFIDDVVMALLALIDHDQIGTYHIVGSSVITPLAIARMVAEAAGIAETTIKQTTLEAFYQSSNEPQARIRYPRNAALANDTITRFLAPYGQKMHTFAESLAIMKEQGLAL